MPIANFSKITLQIRENGDVGGEVMAITDATPQFEPRKEPIERDDVRVGPRNYDDEKSNKLVELLN